MRVCSIQICENLAWHNFTLYCRFAKIQQNPKKLLKRKPKIKFFTAFKNIGDFTRLENLNIKNLCILPQHSFFVRFCKIVKILYKHRICKEIPAIFKSILLCPFCSSPIYCPTRGDLNRNICKMVSALRVRIESPP